MARSGSFHGESKPKKISPQKAARKNARVEQKLSSGQITYGQAVRREESIAHRNRAQEPLPRVTKSQIKMGKSQAKATRTIAKARQAITAGKTRQSGVKITRGRAGVV